MGGNEFTVDGTKSQAYDLIKKNKPKEAMAALAPYLNDEATDWEIGLLAACAFRMQGDFVRAIGWLEPLLSRKESHRSAVLELRRLRQTMELYRDKHQNQLNSGQRAIANRSRFAKFMRFVGLLLFFSFFGAVVWFILKVASEFN